MKKKCSKPATRFSIMCIFAFLLMSGAPSVAISGIEILSISPRTVAQEIDPLFDRPSSGLHVVGVGSPVYLQAKPENVGGSVHSVRWTFESFPEGAAPDFLVQGDAITAFIPPVEGEYRVRMEGVSSPANNPIQSTQLIVAARYVGAGILEERPPRVPECAICHLDNAEGWLETAHASALRNPLEGRAKGPWEASCFQCHTTGFDLDPFAFNNGFDDVANAAGVDLDALAEQANEAYRLRQGRNANNEVNYFDELPTTVRALANVQCESCHGPGSMHLGNIERIAKPWGAESCAQCHDSQRNDVVYTFDTSEHASLPTLFERFPTLTQSECAKCHTAEGFVALHLEGGSVADLDPHTAPHGVSCAACHDPHQNRVQSQLRMTGGVILESGHLYHTEGRDGLCASCHQSRVTGDLEEFIRVNSVGPHYGPQADVMLGINAWTFGLDEQDFLSVHQLIMDESCISCHMAETPSYAFSSEEGALLGGHSFKIAYDIEPESDARIENVENACLSCHMTMTTIDRPLFSLRDYDGDGKVGGIQTEVKGLLNRIANILKERYPEIVIRPDGALNVSDAIYQRMTFTEKASVYNHRLFFLDGSFGVHNARFTVAVLQQSYQALTGVSLKTNYPSAFMVEDGMIENSSIEEWLYHNQ